MSEIDVREKCLDEIEYFINKIDTTMGCTYGDYDCERCSDTGDTICSYKLKNIILQKIKQAKEGAQSNTDGNQHQ